MTLVLTPNLFEWFGRGSLRKSAADAAVEMFRDSLQTMFRPTAKAKSVSEFEEKWQKAATRYAKAYDMILRAYIKQLGPSLFRVEYIKAITQTLRELEKLSIAVHDLNQLYQRHVADSINIATNYDEIFQNNDPQKLERLNNLLRESNYGITFLSLLLSGNVPGPMWVILETKDRTHARLAEIEQSFKLPKENQLLGSLKGDFDFFLNKTRK